MYRVNRTNPDNTPIDVDNSRLTVQMGLTWVGQYYSRYGETLHENMMRLAENFASDDEPGSIDDANALFNHAEGQLWYHTDDADHKGSKILKIFDDNEDVGTNGWKRLELIISEDEPEYHAEGELWYNIGIDPDDDFHTEARNSIKVSRGNRWEDLRVEVAHDSDRLGGFDGDDFVLRDGSRNMTGELRAENIVPNSDNTKSLGSSSLRWGFIYSGLLETDFSKSLIPDSTNEYTLGNSSNRWKEINSITINSENYSDVNPSSDNTYTLGTESRRWGEANIHTLNADYSNDLMPKNDSRSIGESTNRWEEIYGNRLNVVSSSDLIPTSSDEYDLGSNSTQWRRLYVDLIRNANTETLIPNSHDQYDLGDSNNSYRNIYVENLRTDILSHGDIQFDIIRNDRSKGIRWEGLDDYYRLSVEEYSNTENTRLVLDTGTNSNDYFVVRHNDDDKLAVKDDIVDATAGTLRTKGKLQVESTESSSGCEMEYNEGTEALEFRFY